MSLKEVGQKQINVIMDSYDFRQAVLGLEAVEHCWLNEEENWTETGREVALRTKCRDRLEDTLNTIAIKYDKGYFSYTDANDPEIKYYDYGTNTGCITTEAFICDDGDKPWIKINLKICVMDTIQDGEFFDESYK